jgi:hypothetical protein
MVKQAVNFRFDEDTLAYLEWLATVLGVTKTEVIERSLRVLAELMETARRNAERTLGELRRRYGDDAEVTIRVFEKDGRGQAHVEIDGEVRKDVVPYVVKPKDATYVHIFLAVTNEEPTDPVLVPAGRDLGGLLAFARWSSGELPFPNPQNFGLVMRLGDWEPTTLAEAPAEVLERLR